ncbi:hypothetical protein C8034_v005980 [Colletotrichum sidae]|uniref:Uncharacterized protein n=1 Tax=Colletotrichum sidae TaxID=1347389 RepID=A0A4R8T5D2_9PEZI|nr:hypothetical protein C8034_v005980 [Colletotrichum sidae]
MERMRHYAKKKYKPADTWEFRDFVERMNSGKSFYGHEFPQGRPSRAFRKKRLSAWKAERGAESAHAYPLPRTQPSVREEESVWEDASVATYYPSSSANAVPPSMVQRESDSLWDLRNLAGVLADDGSSSRNTTRAATPPTTWKFEGPFKKFSGRDYQGTPFKCIETWKFKRTSSENFDVRGLKRAS